MFAMRRYIYYMLFISIIITGAWQPEFVLAQHSNHTYPLIGWQTFRGAVPDYYARYDLILTTNSGTELAQQIKQRNPNILLVSTKDWNNGGNLGSEIPDEWWVKDSRGNYLTSYGQAKMANLSDVCPKASSGSYAGMRYCDFVPEWMVDRIDVNVWDGVGTNGVWGRDGLSWKYGNNQWSDVDLDGNGVNDLNEHSKDWFLDHWQGGIDLIVTGIRDRMPAGKLIIINSGTKHTWGWDITNGVVDEKLPFYNNETFNKDYYDSFKAAAYQPFVSVADGRPYESNPNVPSESKNDFMGMRFGLVTSMFNDVYFSFQNLEATEHYWSHWYDEFEAEFDMPKGPPQMIRNGLWVRFFDRGAAIASTDGSQHTVSDSDLRGFTGYDGPYFRFQGGQDPEFNNGNQFNSVTLRGVRVGDAPRFIVGDGILLFNEPTHLVADIIIDNVDMGTSPSNSVPSLSGGFQQEQNCRAGAEYYTVRCDWNPGTFPYAISPSGSGTATFTPNIGVAGNYEVFEWHGYANSYTLASNAQHVITHSGGQKTVNVDQTSNMGRWNSLGVYYFDEGTSGSVQIRASGANNHVMADAIKFVFRDGDDLADTTPPDPPTNVRVQ